MALQRIQHILAPVDFSELSVEGLRYAVNLAKCLGARVTVLYADPFLPPPYFTEGSLDDLKKQTEDSKRQAETRLRQLAESEAGESVGIEVSVDEGLPADSIRRVASDSSADLIVMGTHGRSGVNRLILGSVTERVLREAQVPVLVVRGGSSAGQIKSILCPVNDSEPARRALLAATDLATGFGAALNVVHVKQAGAEDSIDDLCAWIPESQRALCTTGELSPATDVAQEVLTLASQSHADLLVLGARHRRFFDTTVLGANTIRMLRHAPCPVLAVFGKERP
jgi:nucleotide-binding universal stress UspA family protein